MVARRWAEHRAVSLDGRCEFCVELVLDGEDVRLGEVRFAANLRRASSTEVN